MTNRKEAYCPRCGRMETVAAENELVMCSRCALLGAEAYAKKNSTPSGKELQKIMEAQRISTKNLAYDLNISQSYLREMERGEKPINKRVYEWMAQHRATQAHITLQPPLF